MIYDSPHSHSGGTCTRLGTGVLGVPRESIEEVVGELEVDEFRHLEEATWDVGNLIMRGIKISQTGGRERERDTITS